MPSLQLHGGLQTPVLRGLDPALVNDNADWTGKEGEAWRINRTYP